MNGIVYDMAQRSPEWFAVRVGMLTGSSADALTSVRKRGTGELQKRIDLRRRLVCERLTGLSWEDGYRSNAMQRGCDLEPQAFAAYEAQTGLVAQRVGFVAHRELKAGCSPDGYVNEWEGIIELKCPLSTTHLEYIQAGTVPEEYKGQILHGLWLTGAQWCDFCSFDDRFPMNLQLLRVRVMRNDFDVMAYDRTVRAFLAEVDAELASIHGWSAEDDGREDGAERSGSVQAAPGADASGQPNDQRQGTESTADAGSERLLARGTVSDPG